MFSIVETRPDIAYVMSVTSRFAKNLSYQHTKTVKIILQYLKGLRDQEIIYGREKNLTLKGIQTLIRLVTKKAKSQYPVLYSC